MVEEAIRSCYTCQTNDQTARPRTAPLQPVPLPEGPWQKLAIDIIGPFEHGPQDCRFAIVLIDYYSKWPEVAFAPAVTSRTVISMLFSVFAREEQPNEIITNNGVQFTSSEFENFLHNYGIKHYKSSLYLPRANGEVERWNRVLKQSLQLASQEGRRWKEAVTELLAAYRSTLH